MQKELEALRNELVSNCAADNDAETKEVCNRIAKLPLDHQIVIMSKGAEKGGSNILIRMVMYRNKSFIHLCNLVDNFPVPNLSELLTEVGNDENGGSALLNAVNYAGWDVPTHIKPLSDLVKKIPLKLRIEIFTQRSNRGKTILNAALESVYTFRNPRGISNELYWVIGDEPVKEAVAKSHAYFNAVVGPLLEVMKDFPLEVKEELYNAIPNSLWYLNRFPEEKQRIKAAIGVHRPFGPIQKTFFSLGVGAAFTGGSFWLLIVAGVITSHAFVMVAWPAAITATAVGLSAILAINLYAKCQNPISAYGSQQDEVVPLLEGKEGPSCLSPQ